MEFMVFRVEVSEKRERPRIWRIWRMEIGEKRKR
jgi:hypothetical protein